MHELLVFISYDFLVLFLFTVLLIILFKFLYNLNFFLQKMKHIVIELEMKGKFKSIIVFLEKRELSCD